jgi:hypothetical protein
LELDWWVASGDARPTDRTIGRPAGRHLSEIERSSARYPERVSWPSSEELEDLVRRFQALTLSHSEWTHAAHLAVGTWHVYNHGPVAALNLLRTRIRLLNDHHGTPNTDDRGYHETITRAYVLLIAGLIGREPQDDAAASARSILASSLAARDALLQYYSRDVLMSVAARRSWVPPTSPF